MVDDKSTGNPLDGDYSLVAGGVTDRLEWHGAQPGRLEPGRGQFPQGTALPKTGGAGKVDVAGAVLIAGATVSLLLVAEWGGRTYAWTSGVILALIGAFAALLVLFLRRQRRAVNPLIPLRLFANPVLRVALPATALLGGSIVYLPTYLQATAAAIPDILIWGVPAAIVLATLMAALPRTVNHPAPEEQTGHRR